MVQGTTPDAAGHFITPQEASRSLLALISDRPALSPIQLETHSMGQHAATGLTCFRSLVAGSGSMQATMQRIRVLPFRYTVHQLLCVSVCKLHQCIALMPMITACRQAHNGSEVLFCVMLHIRNAVACRNGSTSCNGSKHMPCVACPQLPNTPKPPSQATSRC